LANRLDAKLSKAFGDTPPPHCRAWRAQLAAEMSRLHGAGDPEAWDAARGRWDELGHVLQSVYCAWRQAEALLAADGGERGAARELLVAAHAVAAECGAEPLREELDALSRRARIDLAAGGEEGAEEAAVPSAAESAGLTPREAEVLGLVAEGRTNRQIAEALFISEKTASVHVSRILAKLDADSRGEAAAMARQLGVRAEGG
jgi:DNA-binding CsgD family transcriptional regulator